MVYIIIDSVRHLDFQRFLKRTYMSANIRLLDVPESRLQCIGGIEINSFVKVFENMTFGNVRVIMRDDQPWFVGKDICQAFGDKNHSRSISRVDGEDKMVMSLDTNGGRQNITVVNESGLYSLLFNMQPQKANKTNIPDAYPLDETDAYSLEIQERIIKLRAFRKWVTSEVLPSIRKYGAYLTDEALQIYKARQEILSELGLIDEKDTLLGSDLWRNLDA